MTDASARELSQPAVLGCSRRLALASAVAVLAACQLGRFVLWSPEALTRSGSFRDDGFFFSVLARNFRHLGFLSFDGEMTTNGFQPLWMLVQILLASALPTVETAALLGWSSWICYVAFVFLTVWYVSRDQRLPAILSAAIVSGYLLLNPRFHHVVVRGIETPLLLALLMVWLLVIRGMAESSGRGLTVTAPQAAALGVLTALCFLTRTDYLWVAVVTAAWLWRGARVPGPRLVVHVAAVAALVAPYLIFNVLTEGSPVPTAAASSASTWRLTIPQSAPTSRPTSGRVSSTHLQNPSCRT